MFVENQTFLIRQNFQRIGTTEWAEAVQVGCNILLGEVIKELSDDNGVFRAILDRNPLFLKRYPEF
jgi:hypothetical protein